MISTSPRHARHARVAPGRATGASEAAEGVAGPRRRRRIRLLLIVAPVTAVLVAVGLVGMHIVTWPVHMTADTSRQHAGTDVVNALPAALSCCRFSTITPAAASPSASPRHHAAKPSVAPRHHATVKATPSASGGTGGDGTSAPGSVAGWRLTYSTDFPGNSLPDGWLAYNGEPGGDPYGNWQPSNVSVSGGALHLMATSSAQGGVKFLGNPQTYGMYLVRMKADYEPGLSINNLAILWPSQRVSGRPRSISSRTWAGPGSIFPPACTRARTGTAAAASPSASNRASNGTAWHTYGVQWTPSAITYTIDGQVWASTSRGSLSSPAQWPTIPMDLTLQSQNQASAQPNGTIETMTVAWVAEYAMSG